MPATVHIHIRCGEWGQNSLPREWGVQAGWTFSISRTFFIYFFEDFSRASTEKNTQQFQALNGLKCSTVGNLGS